MAVSGRSRAGLQPPSLLRNGQAYGESAVSVPALVDEVVASSGQALDVATQAEMGSRLGHDFSQVRVHTDSQAAASAQAMNALAFTTGRDVVFGAGQYAPDTHSGRRLLAHELAHVVQHTGGSSAPLTSRAVSLPGDALEKEAEQVAEQVMADASAATAVGYSRRRPGASAMLSPATGHRAGAASLFSDLPAAAVSRTPQRVQISGRVHTPALLRHPAPGTGSPAPTPAPSQQVPQLVKDLQGLINNATWKEIRKRVYPKESAAGIQRASERHAGTRTDMTGLGAVKSLDHFAAAVRGIQRTWASFSVDQRVKKLGDAANAELTAADVPGFLVVNKEPMEFKGFFTRSAWKFTISEALVSGSALGNADAAEVANTTLHESRHAEQQFLAARFSAGVNKKDGAAIAAEQSIPRVIADKAVAKKFDARTSPAVAALGKQMFQATVTDSAKNQAISDDDGIAEMAVMRAEAQVALTNLQAGATATTIAEATAKRDALRAQILVVEQKYTLYRNIPYEADAHEVGDAAELAFKGWP
jgi:hypothetical protein